MVEARLLRDERGRGSGVVRDSCYDSVLAFPWRQSVDFPYLANAGVKEAVMEPGGPTLPEFDHLRHQTIAAPEGGQWNLTLRELVFDLFEFLHQEHRRRGPGWGLFPHGPLRG